jgi:alpha-1,3-rhamnosyl/mannosyltransferase
MKVCLDIRVSTKGGTSTFISNYVRELDDVPHDHDIQFVFNEGATPLNGKHPRVAAVPYRNRVLEFQWAQVALRKVLKQQRFDVYHSLKHVGPLFATTRTIYRVPAVGQFLGNYPMQRLDHIYWNHVAGRAYRQADLLIAVSDYIRDALIERLKVPADRVVTVHNGVDSRFRRIPPNELPADRWRALGITRPYMLCVGNLVPVKNFSTAIRAYATLSETDAHLPQLVLAGSPRHPHHQELLALVLERRLQDAVRFVGYQSGDDLLHLYNGAEMLIHPSLHEGFSFTILEAMACGLPIIASATTSIPEAAGSAAIYHDDPRDYEELAVCMRQLLDDTELARELSRQALLRAPEFTWNKCVSKTISLYDMLG